MERTFEKMTYGGVLPLTYTAHVARSAMRSIIEGYNGETDNLLKIVTSKHPSDVGISTDKHIH